MISFISGTIQNRINNAIIVLCNGIGYRVVIPERLQDSLAKVGSKVNLYIYSSLNVREGIFVLYGFTTAEELRFFELLLDVSGIGPKGAQNILSAIDLETLQLAIVKGDNHYLKKVSGIGDKTASRIILELRSKVLKEGIGSIGDRDFTTEGDAIDALVSLGYQPHYAREALKSVSEKAITTEDKIKEALRILASNKK